MTSTDLGSAECSLKGRVPAGSWQTCALTYRAGQAGIDDTGSLKIVMRYATDGGVPQFHDPAAPHYTTAAASNGAELQLRYDVKDHRRPWGRTLQVKVLQGFLREGDSIVVTIGDTSGGSPGWRIQSFVEETFELKVLVDRYATYVYDELPRSPAWQVVAGEPARLVAVAPSMAAPNQPFSIRWKLEDRWGNPVGKPRRRQHPGFAAPGVYRVTVSDEPSQLESSSNPIVVRPHASPPRFWADLHGQSEETIGTNSIERYFRFARDWAFLDIAGHQGNDFQITDAFWRRINETTQSMNRSGKFIAFPGWEWSGNTGLGGDRNVFFKQEGGPICRSSRALLRPDEAVDEGAATVEELFARLEQCGHEVMLAPHVGGRYADLTRHHPALEPMVEVHSAWGTFEWMLADAFSRGCRIGVVANSDGHKGRPGASYPGASTFGSFGGLTCVLADALTRDAVWQAYQQRHVYATTGARIFLEVAAADAIMGDCLEGVGDELELRGLVAGTAPIERVEIRDAMETLAVLKTHRPRDVTRDRLKIVWEGAEVRGRGRQVRWDGRLQLEGNRIASCAPFGFWNPDSPCVLEGPRRAHWKSITTGGAAGVILQLERAARGTLCLELPGKRIVLSLEKLKAAPRRYELGGLGKRVSAYWMPPSDSPRELDFRHLLRPAALPGDCRGPAEHPIYVCAVQEDGHRAWSSPIYWRV